jgi:glycosyltransferase involved in cell wall biosynthesis
MTIGIAIPTYKNHLNSLETLLDKISKSTILPNQVSVSISSTEEYIVENKYPFEIILTVTSEYKNPSQNRNIAASKLTTDIISFIDGDDFPHPQRNEFVLKSFNMGSECVVHNYHKNSHLYQDFFKVKYEDVVRLPKYIDTLYVDPIYPKSGVEHIDYHCAHISISKELFDKFKYNEDEQVKYKEDSYYVRTLVENNHPICFLNNKLTLYLK